MKLRTRGNSIRLRLTQGEVSALVEKGRVEEHLAFGGGARLSYALVADEAATAIAARYAEGAITVTVPLGKARTWASSDDVGFEAEQATGGEVLRILVEKDWQCLKPRDGEEDKDAFPHPGSGGSTC